MATDAVNAAASLSDLLTIRAETLAAWRTAGMPPQYSIGGISVDWGQWLAGLDARIESAVKLNQSIGGPFTVVTRVRG